MTSFTGSRSVRTLLSASLIAASSLTFVACSTTTPAETHRDRGIHLAEIGDHAGAASAFEQVTAKYPGDWQAQYMLGLSYLELERPSDARRSLEIAYTQKPDRVEVADALAEALYESGDTTRLFAFLNDQADQSQTPHAWMHLARYAMATDDPDTARVAVDTAIEMDEGSSADPYLLAAQYAEKVGDRELAVRRLRQAYGIAHYVIVSRPRSKF